MARYAPLTLDSAAGLPAPRSTVSRSPVKSAVSKAGLLRRIFDALLQARMHQAQREVARYLATRGRWTDQRESVRRLAISTDRLTGN